MNINFKMSLLLAAALALGALAMPGLRGQGSPQTPPAPSAQASVPAYVVIEIEVTSQDAYLKEFAPLALKAMADAGGTLLVRGGKTVGIDGTPPKPRVILYQFKNLAQAQAALASPAYVSARKIGDKYATFRTFAVEGLAP